MLLIASFTEAIFVYKSANNYVNKYLPVIL